MLSQNILSPVILEKIEADYQSTKESLNYLNRGDNGSVYRLRLKSGKEFCIKSILKGNETAENDYKNYQTVYGNGYRLVFSGTTVPIDVDNDVVCLYWEDGIKYAAKTAAGKIERVTINKKISGEEVKNANRLSEKSYNEFSAILQGKLEQPLNPESRSELFQVISSRGFVLGLRFDFKSYEDERFNYFTMPFFSGKSLAMIDGEVKEVMRLIIFKKLTEAVHRMHLHGVIHNDLKDANIIVNFEHFDPNDIEVHIIDFGRSVAIFDQFGRAAAKHEDLALPNNTNIFFQIARKCQPQTAPEHSSVVNAFKKWIGKHWFSSTSEENIGFRTDYYSLGKLFKNLLPQCGQMPGFEKMAKFADDIIGLEGSDRDSAYHELCLEIERMLKIHRINQKKDEPEIGEADRQKQQRISLN